MWLETIHKSEDHKEKCPTCGSGVQRRVYGEMYAGSQVLNGERVEIRRVPNEGFADPIYLDPLTQYFDGGLYRLWKNERYLSRGGKKLHRAVWELAFGKLPEGHHVHHKDGNPANNLLSNLECIEAGEHLSLSGKQRHMGAQESFTSLAREKAAEWHRSEEGRLWHRRLAERTQNWTKWKREQMQCAWCNKIFEGLVRKSGNQQKYCHPNCKAAFYRNRKAIESNG